jgi:hypothetical protein
MKVSKMILFMGADLVQILDCNPSLVFDKPDFNEDLNTTVGQ